MTFTDTLKSHRLRMGLTQRKVAEALNVSQTIVYLWEKGRAHPSYMNMVRLEQLFGTGRGDLLALLAYELSAEQEVMT